MHPGMMYWWKSRHGGGDHHHHEHAGCGTVGWDRRHHHRHHRRHGDEHEHGWSPWQAAMEDDLAGAFGVRRPLRFLAHKLDLDEDQVGRLAAILDELKTERAQAEVDGRRAVAAFADAVAGDEFDAQRATEGGTSRVRSAENLRDAVHRALGRIHQLLRPEQRQRLAYLIRTGTLRI